jgi:hypothetical protein
VTFHRLDRAACVLAIWAIGSMSAPTANAAGPLAEPAEPAVSKSVTVEELEGILAEHLPAKHKDKRDAEVARQLSLLELRERMDGARLRSLEQRLPGPKSRRALVALADASVFLAPPAGDVIAQAPPDAGEQQHMLSLTVDYVSKTLHKLPDFYATRTISRYEADVQTTRTASAGSEGDLRWRAVGSTKAVVVYRDGKEVIDPREWGGQHLSNPEGDGLINRGTFGPILLMVIRDAAHAHVAWDQWERSGTGVLAVFRVGVPENQSHYSTGFREFSRDQTTAYHGEMSIDPDTGTILRLMVQADLPFGSPILRADIMVEYGPVEIGGRTYICPVRGVSMARDEIIDPFSRPAPNREITLLNDMSFAEYHQFRSDVRILPGDPPTP